MSKVSLKEFNLAMNLAIRTSIGVNSVRDSMRFIESIPVRLFNPTKDFSISFF